MKSPSSGGRFSSNEYSAARHPREASNIKLTGGGKVFHRIQKADRLNNTSLPKMIIPSGTVESTGPTGSGGGRV